MLSTRGAMAKKKQTHPAVMQADPTMREMKKALASAQRLAGDGAEIGGTPHTILKLREPTIGRLVTSGKVGTIELGVIGEIEKVYSHLCASQILRGYEIRERLSRSKRPEPTWFFEAYHARFKPWADKWSARRKRESDPSLSIVFDIMFSDRSGKDIDGERGWRHGTALDLFVNAIRDYAAMAGWVDRNTAARWSEVARDAFPLLRMR